MTSIVVDVPAMYADHHVVEVRRMLLDVPGVDSIYASSAFRVVEIEFDESLTTAEALERLIGEAGYQIAPPVPTESGEPVPGGAGPRFKRLTATHPAAGSGVAFRQDTVMYAAGEEREGWRIEDVGRMHR